MDWICIIKTFGIYNLYIIILLYLKRFYTEEHKCLRFYCNMFNVYIIKYTQIYCETNITILKLETSIKNVKHMSSMKFHILWSISILNKYLTKCLIKRVYLLYLRDDTSTTEHFEKLHINYWNNECSLFNYNNPIY